MLGFRKLKGLGFFRHSPLNASVSSSARDHGCNAGSTVCEGAIPKCEKRAVAQDLIGMSAADPSVYSHSHFEGPALEVYNPNNVVMAFIWGSATETVSVP